MESVKSLVLERRHVKSRLTSFGRFVESADVRENLTAFEKRVQSNQCLLEKFESIQSQIDTSLMDTPQAEAQVDEREQFEEKYFNIMAVAEKRIIEVRGQAAPSTASATSDRQVPSDPHPAAQLPVVQLPIFTGDCGQWIRFRDTFLSLVHSSDKLSAIDRFNYLTTSLSGAAARTIESFSVSAANYELAWARLREKYDDPRLLVNHHIQSLLEIEPTRRQDGKSLSEFADRAVNNMRALGSLLEPAGHLDAVVNAALAKRLDVDSRDEWERRAMGSKTLPTFHEFVGFMEQRSQYLLRRDASNVPSSLPSAKTVIRKSREAVGRTFSPVSHVAGKARKCVVCTGDHFLNNCSKWKAMSVSERHAVVKQARVCYNCLAPGHGVKACTRRTCSRCNGKHHTLLHREESDLEEREVKSEPPTVAFHNLSAAQPCTRYTVLSTAVVVVIGKGGNRYKCRALLDSGSQANFVSKGFCKRAGLPCRAFEYTVGALGRVKSTIRATTQVRLESSNGNFKANLGCLVMEAITERLPNMPLERANIPTPSGITPADPEFGVPGNVDLLIGAGLFWELLCVGQVRVGTSHLLWQKTRLGWVLGGSLQWPALKGKVRFASGFHASTNASLEAAVSRFWEVEEVGNVGRANGRDPCEKHFRENATRDENGRFVVAIPFNERVGELGGSRAQAERRFLNLERRFKKNPELGREYKDFMREYVELGHMSKLDAKSANEREASFYLPHHAVLKGTSSSTKLRVVFDGSARTTTGVSLNDAQFVGPQVQDDLFGILVRFRKHPIVLSADIAKMYRQVAIREEDRRYQRILWRFSEDEGIGAYALNTVTYGTASASYLATRVLQQVGRECARSFPSASKAILHDFYVDDLLTGCETVQQVAELRESLTRVLASAGFPLRKWASNDPRAISHHGGGTDQLEFRSVDMEPKTLGLLWSIATDELGYSSNYQIFPRITKRHVLAELAQIFDPLGLVGPLIVRAKIFMQGLWAAKVGWDESLPQELQSQWGRFREEIREISTLRVPRRVPSSSLGVELHGFSDASERAYGAAIYLRSRTQQGRWVSRLVCAKSRVAPLKAISLPRLELCGAVLLARLLEKVREALRLKSCRDYCWTDSQIVLAWIRERSRRWKTFVANRVSEIQELTGPEVWSHVASGDNPADILSRGADSAALKSDRLWWHGPTWLSLDSEKWPHCDPPVIEVPEARAPQILQLATTVGCESVVLGLATRYSCLDKLCRVLAYVFRFCKGARRQRDTGKPGSLPCPLAVDELVAAERRIILATQERYFGTELTCRKKRLQSQSSEKEHAQSIDRDACV
ncbi:uncharacterized protein LOC143151436 [Ptiloglossa arizonensis]|uniref:uncharacterized protein LOC143151436 n=1 Tax=Ptiloglossa arizonensis TaxID=3350558 RepID=UPI003FA17305